MRRKTGSVLARAAQMTARARKLGRLIEHQERVSPAPVPAAHWLAAKDLQTRRARRDRERQHKAGIVASRERLRERDIGFAAVDSRGRELFTALDDDALVRLFHYMQDD